MIRKKIIYIFSLLIFVIILLIAMPAGYASNSKIEDNEKIEEITITNETKIEKTKKIEEITTTSNIVTTSSTTIKETEIKKELSISSKNETPHTSNKETPILKNDGYITFTATAYCNGKCCCGKWAGGKTASGTYPKEGRTIAVDPKIIPLGSKVYIEGYGYYIAEDTGSAIKGKKIDIYFNSHKSATNFGKRTIRVKVVK